MRVLALVLGGLVLIGGGAVVVLADQERQAELRQTIELRDGLDRQLEELTTANTEQAERLTTLRSGIAEQETALRDTEGFLE